jgi:hypothetical protein
MTLTSNACGTMARTSCARVTSASAHARRSGAPHLHQPLAEIGDTRTAATAHDVSQTRGCCRRVQLLNYIRNGLCYSHLSQAYVAGVEEELGHGDALVAEVEDLVVFRCGGGGGTDAAEARGASSRRQHVPVGHGARSNEVFKGTGPPTHAHKAAHVL